MHHLKALADLLDFWNKPCRFIGVVHKLHWPILWLLGLLYSSQGRCHRMNHYLFFCLNDIFVLHVIPSLAYWMTMMIFYSMISMFFVVWGVVTSFSYITIIISYFFKMLYIYIYEITCFTTISKNVYILYINIFKKI